MRTERSCSNSVCASVIAPDALSYGGMASADSSTHDAMPLTSVGVRFLLYPRARLNSLYLHCTYLGQIQTKVLDWHSQRSIQDLRVAGSHSSKLGADGNG